MQMNSNPNDFYEEYGGKESSGKKDIYKKNVFGGLGLTGTIFMVVSGLGIILSLALVKENSIRLMFNLIFFGLQFLLGVFLMRAKVWAWWVALLLVSLNILVTIVLSSFSTGGLRVPWLPILLLATLICSRNELVKQPTPGDREKEAKHE